jgi:hypothetical protein
VLGVQAPGHTATVDLVERKGSTSARHPWELARAEVFLTLLQRQGLLDESADWLDAGAGDAWFAMQLRRLLPVSATITCWDINYTPDDIRSLEEAGAEGASFVADRPTTRFDTILMLDVIEHVADDHGFVSATVGDLLRDEGFVLASVPAYQSLFSSHDRAFHHFRRYSPAECRRVLELAGLTVVRSGGLFSSLLPTRVGQLVVDRVRPAKSFSAGVGDWHRGSAVTNALTRALTSDGKLSLALSERGLALPGLSYWALCRLGSS